MSTEPTSHEIELMEMLAGTRQGEWGAWVGACLEFLQDSGYATKGTTPRLTHKGTDFLAARSGTTPPASSSGQAPIPSEAAVEAALVRAACLAYFGPDEWNRIDERGSEPETIRMTRAVRAVLGGEHPAGEVTKGWQIVPTHLTIAMGRAAWEAQDHNGASAVSGIADGRTYALDTLWAALLSSAPQPPKSNSGGK